MTQAAEEKAKRAAQKWKEVAAQVEQLKLVEIKLWEEVRDSHNEGTCCSASIAHKFPRTHDKQAAHMVESSRQAGSD